MAVPGRSGPSGGPPGPEPQAPGWYPDPDRTGFLRYWDGVRWTQDRRPRPAWTGSEKLVVVAGGQPLRDGPVRPGGPPDPVASTAAPSRETPARGDSGGSAGPSAGGPQRGGQLRPGGGDGGGSGRAGGGGGGGGGQGGDGGPSSGAGGGRRGVRSRRTWLLMASVAILAAVGVGLAGEAMRPKRTGRRVLTDNAYIRLADGACTRTLPGLRPPDTGPFGTVQGPDQTASQIEHAATGLATLATTLRTLPMAPVDRAPVEAWLDGWTRYIALGRSYAAFLRLHGTANPGSLISDSVNQAKATDNFALANGLGSCTLFTTPQPADTSTAF